MPFRNIDITPASHGSDRRPEAREFWVGTPEFITQSRETEELAALPLNTAETGTLQKVAIEVMEGESKERCRRRSRTWQLISETWQLGAVRIIRTHSYICANSPTYNPIWHFISIPNLSPLPLLRGYPPVPPLVFQLPSGFKL
ncbi:hypothetical protein DFH08DRAFT_818869 [Mycena albidolilacea]|uniref:Uncharacterized protein n=1 Tax=Mycena albidolilacea TaxID=1033008 RepID=A0AAD7EGZ5_9AGAR|nr:hypothetical protein DFH08DRAFT_818869 [Mycena albidolilacea]